MITARPEDVGLSTSRLQRINDFTHKYVDEGYLPGTMTLVARRGQVVHFDCYGQRNLEAGLPIAEDTIFRIFSMTKPITSVAALSLYEQGHFTLDTPVSHFIPAFQHMEVFESGTPEQYTTVKAERQMTIGDLLKHTSGLTYTWLNRKTVGKIYENNRLTIFEGYSPDYLLEDYVNKLAEMPLLYSPGTAWHYSTSVEVLGRVIEVITGKRLDVFLKERVLDPLGMADTDFYVPEDKWDRFAKLYMPKETKDGLVHCPIPWHAKPEPSRMLRGGDGLVSTTPDYLKFASMMLNQGRYPGGQMLSPKTVHLMTQNHLPGDMMTFGNSPIRHMSSPGIGFGLGVAVTVDPIQANAIGSPGEYYWTGGGHTMFFIDPKEELIAIFMTQLFPPAQFPLDKEFKTAVYQSILESNIG